MNAMRGCVEAPFIVWRGRFPGEINARTLATDFRKAVASILPRLRRPGTRPGSAEPGFVQPHIAAFDHRPLQGD